MSEPTERDVQATFGQLGARVYTYRDDAGVVYYSFTETLGLISPPKRLKLENHRGAVLASFLSELRRVGEALKAGKG